MSGGRRGAVAAAMAVAALVVSLWIAAPVSAVAERACSGAGALVGFAPAVVEAAGYFALTADLECAENLHFVRLTVEYGGGGELMLESVAEGAFLRSGGDTIFSWQITAPGRVEIIVSLAAPGAVVAGSGTVAVLKYAVQSRVEGLLITYDESASQLIGPVGEVLPVIGYGAAEIHGLAVPAAAPLLLWVAASVALRGVGPGRGRSRRCAAPRLLRSRSAKAGLRTATGVACCAVLACSGDQPGACQADDYVLDAPGRQKIQRKLDELVAEGGGNGGGILLIASTTEGVIMQGTSGTRVAGEDAAIGAEDTFEIASISKTFTAATVLRLFEAGRFDLDARLDSILPAQLVAGLLVIDGQSYGPGLTARQLLNHTGGLPDYWNDPPFVRPKVNAFYAAYEADETRFWRPEEILPYVAELTPIATPGSTFHYGDSGYLLLGLALERITGKALHDVYREELYGGLSMQDSYLPYREPRTTQLPESHRYEGGHDMTGKVHQTADWAGGGLVSTAADLGRFVRGLLENRVFRLPATLDAMRQQVSTGWEDLSYGLGLFRVDLGEDLGELWGHEGYGASFAYYWPRHGVSFTGTLNQTETEWWPLVETAIVAGTCGEGR
ncbi:MAG: beta-lactamase family protein [Candidatus Schekmanbacteria bacterium]|nr:beta-lactamase family protein [Candidatus Schekmanbacteria bacterium]